MADIIHLLPDYIANQIAAGEVVQRPASVVKELIENAIDAKATNIKVLIKDCGKNTIQVIDNGTGMSETDARMCFERHATSKIQTAEDLGRINTMGFRGEAMASIAAVAMVELKTKRKADLLGTSINIKDSRIADFEACSMPDGTSIAVKNLFFNVPARKNFLKSNPVELRHIYDEFLDVALAYPEIHFSLFNEEEETYHLKPGNLKQRIIGVFGKKYEQSLLGVEEETDFLKISGFIGKPDLAKKQRGEQFFFANNRFIKSGYLNHAVDNSFEGLLPEGSFPFYCLFLEINPAKIDINVHPTKKEIRFEDEKLIYAILKTAIKRSLNQHHAAPTLNFDDEQGIANGTLTQDNNTGSLKLQPVGASMMDSHTRSVLNPGSRQEDWNELYKVLTIAQPQEEEENEQELVGIVENEQKPVMQLHNKFIISSIRSGMIIVNQQLAHERVLYEKYVNLLDKHNVYSQRLLFPEVLQLDVVDYTLAKQIKDELTTLGFELEEFGKNAFILTGLPLEFKNSNQKEIFEMILGDYKENIANGKLEKKENICRAMARNACIRSGRPLNTEEMTRLIDELFACKTPYFSPDGRPTLITVSAQELSKKFKLN